jgi:hypothetical protein
MTKTFKYEILHDHFNPFAVLAVKNLNPVKYPGERTLPLPHKYCKSLGVKSIELWESPFFVVKNASASSEGEY